MRIIIEAMVSMIFIVLLCATGTDMLAAQIDMANARAYQGQIIRILENSAFDEEVIHSCIEQALEDGYELKISVYKPEEETSVMAKIRLEYDIRIPVFHSTTRHFLVATAG